MGERAGTARVVVGDGRDRCAAAAAFDGDGPLIEVPPVLGPVRPWSGLDALVDAIRSVDPAAPVPVAVDAARSGAPIGDHLGLGADLRALLAAVVDDGPARLVVHDAHALDLSTAAALGWALETPPTGLRALVLQDGSDRGLTGLPARRPARAVVERIGEQPGPAEAAAAGGVLDAAWGAEQRGDWLAAARWWLEGGRPERADEALLRAPASPARDELVARLALVARSTRRWRPAVARAVAGLDRPAPLAAARLLLLDAAACISQGNAVGAAGGLDAYARVIDRAQEGRDRRAVVDLHAVVGAMAVAASGGDAALLLARVERPLARLGTGIDGDAVRLLASAALPIGWSGSLVEARALLDRLIGVLHGRRRFVPLPLPLATSAWLARRRARAEVALTDGSRAVELGRAAGARNDVRFALAEVAHVEALQGRVDDCRAHVAELVPDGVPRGAAQIGAVSALAAGELLADRPDVAVALLEPVRARCAGSLAPTHTAWQQNLVEAYVLTGSHAAAARVLDELEAWAARSGSRRELGLVAWCRGMVAEAGAHDPHFDRARTLLEPHPTLRWRAELHRLRRLLAEGRRTEAEALAEQLADEAVAAGVPAGVAQVRRLQATHGLPDGEPRPSSAVLSVDDLRIALALTEGADDDEIAVRLQLTPRRVGDARARILGALRLTSAHELHGLLPLEARDPGGARAEVRILGPVLVMRGGTQCVPPAGRPATLLAIVAAERSVPVDRALDVLWPDDDPMRSRPRLRNVLARLRAAVGPVVSRDGELLVVGPDVVVDAIRFDELAGRALHAAPDDVEQRAEEALAAWTGLPLPAWPYEDWAADERIRLVRRCVEVLVRRAEHRAAVGALDAAIDDLEEAVALDPDAGELWQRAVDLAEAEDRVGRARSLRRRAAGRDVELR